MNRGLRFLLVLAVVMIPLAALAGSLTLTTYYPAPTGYYDLLNANNIGVGTTLVSGKLTVVGEGSGYATFGTTGCGATITGLQLSGSAMSCQNYNIAGSSSNSHLYINRASGGSIYFKNDGNTQMNVSNAGNLGIGILDSDATATLQVKGTTSLGGTLSAPSISYGVTIGDTATDFTPSLQNKFYNLLLNSKDTSSIGFYDVGSSIGSIRYANKLFTVGQDDGWGSARTYFVDNVGIGNENPQYRLAVAGTAYVSGATTIDGNAVLNLGATINNGAIINNGATINSGGLSVVGNTSLGGTTTVTSGNFSVTSGSGTFGNGVTVSNGNLLVNTGNFGVAGTSTLSGNVGIRNAPSGSYGLAVTGGILSPDGFYYSSDARLKTNLSPIPLPLDKINRLTGFQFQWAKDNRPSLGVLAQDVEKIFPEIVRENQDGIKSVDYALLTPLLIEAIKSQQEQINVLKEELQKLRDQKQTPTHP